MTAHTGRVAGLPLRGTSRVVNAALDAGHDPVVEHAGKRFRLSCSCGFKTPAQMNRKNAFAAITEHVYAAGHVELRKRAGDTPPENDVPHSVGGRA
jgi:hypothetical protein